MGDKVCRKTDGHRMLVKPFCGYFNNHTHDHWSNCLVVWLAFRAKKSKVKNICGDWIDHCCVSLKGKRIVHMFCKIDNRKCGKSNR